MKNIETAKTAFKSLGSNKVRSFLTMLGVIIGVFAVVTLVSLVQGVKNYVTDQLNSLGSNLIMVLPGKADFNTDPSLYLGSNKLSEEHVDLINTYAGDKVVSVTPALNFGKMVTYKTRSYYASVMGMNYQAPSIYNVEFEYGRFFTEAEQKTKARVALIGYSVEEELFPDRNGLGERIKVGSDSFEVIGIIKKKSRDFDTGVYIPYTTALDRYEEATISAIAIKAKDATNIELTTKEIKMALLRDLKSDEFTLMTQEDMLSSISSILGILTTALAAIAGISLLVGGIGIMNIMLVSVTERTREIGLRKALGATSFNIGLQFLVESVVISVSGGLVGLLLGWIATLIANNWIRAEVPLWAIILAFGFSLFVGIVFGTYPALKASKKDPIEALRYE